MQVPHLSPSHPKRMPQQAYQSSGERHPKSEDSAWPSDSVCILDPTHTCMAVAKVGPLPCGAWLKWEALLLTIFYVRKSGASSEPRLDFTVRCLLALLTSISASPFVADAPPLITGHIGTRGTYQWGP